MAVSRELLTAGRQDEGRDTGSPGAGAEQGKCRILGRANPAPVHRPPAERARCTLLRHLSMSCIAGLWLFFASPLTAQETMPAPACTDLREVNGESSMPCDQSCLCPDAGVCTRDWNTGILYQLQALGIDDQFGHCIAPGQSRELDGPGIRADLATLSRLGRLADTEPAHLFGFNASGVPYRFPDHAEIRIENPIEINFRVLLEGNGALLRVRNGVDAIVLTPGSDYSRLEDFSILAFSVNDDNSGAIGVDVQSAGVRLDNLRIGGMGVGVRAWDRDGAGAQNTSLQRWRDLVITGSDEYGVYIDGNDSNASLLAGLSLSGNRVGIQASGFLGSTYVGNHLEQNGIGLRTDTKGASRATFLGTYIENSDAVEMSAQSNGVTIVGGQLAVRDGLVGDHIGGQRSQLTFEARAQDINHHPEDEHIVTVTIPSVVQASTGNKVAAMEFMYRHRDCEPGNDRCRECPDGSRNCAYTKFPAWKIDRRLDVGLARDAWEIRPTSARTSRSTFGWSSNPAGNEVTPEIRRKPLCEFFTSSPQSPPCD